MYPLESLEDLLIGKVEWNPYIGSKQVMSNNGNIANNDNDLYAATKSN